MSHWVAVVAFAVGAALPGCRSAPTAKPVKTSAAGPKDPFRIEGFVLGGAPDTCGRLAAFEVQGAGGAPCDGGEAQPVDLRRPGMTCAIHGQALRDDLVDVQYGLLVAPSDEATTASRTQFPHANTWVDGGCAVLCIRKAHVSYCEACRVSRVEWRRVHRADDAAMRPNTLRTDGGL
jgi:hypothetical protein